MQFSFVYFWFPSQIEKYDNKCLRAVEDTIGADSFTHTSRIQNHSPRTPKTGKFKPPRGSPAQVIDGAPCQKLSPKILATFLVHRPAIAAAKMDGQITAIHQRTIFSSCHEKRPEFCPESERVEEEVVSGSGWGQFHCLAAPHALMPYMVAII